jgi:predicted ribosome quality control (RQC) complex YloA/Tae2 family protein
MPQDAFHLNRLIAELSCALVGGQINRVSQVSKDEITLIVYNNFHTQKLIISANASFSRVCLSAREKDPLPIPPAFCMLLRKHLLGGEILSIKQWEFERICEIEILCKTDFSSAKRTLIAEVMGKYSNVILVEDGIILGALKTTTLETTHRVLFAGAKYEYPAPQDKLSPFDSQALKKREEEYFSLLDAITPPCDVAMQEELIAAAHSRWINNGSIAKCQGVFSADMADDVLRRNFLAK